VLDLHAQFPGQHVLAVAHGGVLRALDRRHGIHDEHFPNLGGRRFTLGGEPVEISVGERVSLLQGRDVVVTTPTQI
jgi:broad specificity phosphatase PhoE